MNIKFKFFTILLFLISFSFIGVSQNTDSGTLLAVKIDGMHCAGGCAMSIERTLNNTVGITDANVDFSSSVAMIEYDPSIDEITILTLIREMKGGAYDVSLLSNEGPTTKKCSKGKQCCKVSGKVNSDCDQKSSGCCSGSKKECSSKKKKK